MHYTSSLPLLLQVGSNCACCLLLLLFYSEELRRQEELARQEEEKRIQEAQETRKRRKEEERVRFLEVNERLGQEMMLKMEALDKWKKDNLKKLQVSL